MSPKALLGFVAALVIILPLSALLGKLIISWIGGIQVTFPRVLSSTSIAYVATFTLAWIVSFLGKPTTESNGLRLLAGWGILSVCHINFSKSSTGERLSPTKAIFVGALQAATTLLAFVLVLLATMALKKAFA